MTGHDGNSETAAMTERRWIPVSHDSMEECKPLADRLREHIPEERFHVYEI